MNTYPNLKRVRETESKNYLSNSSPLSGIMAAHQRQHISEIALVNRFGQYAVFQMRTFISEGRAGSFTDADWVLHTDRHQPQGTLVDGSGKHLLRQ